MILSKKSIDAIIGFEVGSPELYTKKYSHPVWPGGESGITIGIGYDLGYNTTTQIKLDWKNYLNESVITDLCLYAGLKADKAKDVLSKTKSITVPYEAAYKVYLEKTIKRFSQITKDTFPGVENLNPDAQGALVSLVFNRGGLVDNSDRRKEMKKIKELVPKKDYKGIAQQLRSMKRLWDEKTAGGLIKRREDEAVLVETSDRKYTEDEKIKL